MVAGLVAAGTFGSVMAEDARAVEAFGKGVAARDKGDLKGAVSAFTMALGYDPGFADARLARGVAYSQLASTQKALEDVNAVTRQYPKLPQGYLAKADVYFNTQQYVEALKNMDLAIARTVDSSKQRAGRGKILFALGRFDEALVELNKALNYYPDDKRARFNRALTLGILRRQSESIEDWNILVALDPTDLDARGQRMHTNGLLRRMAELEEDCRYLMKERPDSPAPYYYIGFFYESTGDRDKATAAFSQAIALDGKDPRPYIDRARMAGLERNFDAALADLRKALELAPGHELAVNLEIDYLCQMGRADEALVRFDEVIKKFPNRSAAYYGRGSLKSMRKQYQEALEDFTRAIKLQPNDELAYAGRGLVHSNLRQDEKALADFEKAIALNPHSPVPCEKLATHYSARGDAAAEYKFATKSCELDGWHISPALVLYIEACERLGKKEEAQKWIQKVLEQPDKLDPELLKLVRTSQEKLNNSSSR